MRNTARLLSKSIAALLATIIGCAIIVLAAKTMAPRLLALPSLPVVDAVESNVDVSLETLEHARDRVETAAKLGLPPDLAADAALLALALSAHPDRPIDSRLSDLEQARRELRASLAEAPLNAMNWTRLAYAEYLLNQAQPSRAMIDALRMSTRLSTYDPGLMFNRLRLWFAADDELDEVDTALLRRQLYLAFEEDPAFLMSLAERHGKLFKVRTHLLKTPADPRVVHQYMPIAIPEVVR